MIIAQVLLTVVFLLIIPELIGLLILYFTKIEKKIAYALPVGYIIEFAICQIISIPCIYTDLPFSLLFYTFITCLLVLTIISLIVNKKEFKSIFIDNGIKKLKEMRIASVIVLILVLIQVGALVKYAHIDDDDTTYIGTAVTSIETDTLFKYDATTGAIDEVKAKRYTVGPFPMYVAIAANFSYIHPTILAHTILPLILIPMAYIVYALIAERLFKGDKQKTRLFLIFLSIIYMFGNYTEKNNFSFLLLRIWQGKAILANIIIPFVYLWFMESYKNKFSFIYCFLQMMICFAGCLTTTMGIIMPPLVILVLTLIYAIKDRKINYIIRSGITCLPCLAYGIFYFI